MTERRGSKKNRYRLNSEHEVYSNRSRSPTLVEMDDLSSTLQSMIQRQASTMVELRKSEMTEITAVETTEDSKCDSEEQSACQAAFELGSTHVWSESDETSLPAVSPGSDFHDSIEAIREEASRVDAAIALDQLDTMRSELESLRKELSCRDSKIRGLRAIIQVKDNRLSTLQLERELYKADVGCDESDSAYSLEPQLIPTWSSSSQISMTAECSTPDSRKLPRSPQGSMGRHSIPGNRKTNRSTSAPDSSQTFIAADLKVQGNHKPQRSAGPASSQTPSADRSISDGLKEQTSVASSSLAPSLVVPSGTGSLIIRTTKQAPATRTSIDLSHQQESPPNAFRNPSSRELPRSRAIIMPTSRTASSHPPIESSQPVSRQESSAVLPMFTEMPPTAPHYPESHRWQHTIGCSHVRGSSAGMVAVPQPRQLHADTATTPHREETTYLVMSMQDDMSIASCSTSTSRSRLRHAQMQFPEDHSAAAPNHRPPRAKVTRSRSSKKNQSRDGLTFDDSGNKTCLPVPKPSRLLRPLRKKNSGSNYPGKEEDASSKDLSSIGSCKVRTDELTNLLRTSLETSEELRKRLAMVSTYYENVVEELQSNLRTNNAERGKVERNLLHQIAALKRARRNTIEESKFRRDYRAPARNELKMCKENEVEDRETSCRKLSCLHGYFGY